MTQKATQYPWINVTPEERAEIETALAGIAARFRTRARENPARSLSECYDGCAEMEQAMAAYCASLTGYAAVACTRAAVEAGGDCADACLDGAGVEHG